MIIINDKRRCSGCKACINACAFDAIKFEYDPEGFYYPYVDESACVECRACESACPYYDSQHGVREENKEYQPRFFAAQLANKAELRTVSSGGVFQALAQTVLNFGGIVYGAEQTEVDIINHVRIVDHEGLARIKRSKYFQSDIKDTFLKAKKDLNDGNVVLFSGTGCQIAGLICFLRDNYEKLVTCEVVCHGVPSIKVWKQYKTEKEEASVRRITGLVFRNKSKGWRNNQYEIIYEDGTREYERSTTQIFHAGYLQGFFNRPSCGNCIFAEIPRVADITLADFWKYNGMMKDNNLGVSLVSVNNEKGERLFALSERYLIIEPTSGEEALDSCRHLNTSPVENEKRGLFLETVFTKGYHVAADWFIEHKQSVLKRIIRRIKNH